MESLAFPWRDGYVSLIVRSMSSVTRRWWSGLPWVTQFKSSMYTLTFCSIVRDAGSAGCVVYNPVVGRYDTHGVVDSVMYEFTISIAVSEVVQNRSWKLTQPMGRTISMQRSESGSEGI